MGPTVRIGIIPLEPYVMPCFYNRSDKLDPDCKRPGLSIEIINLICSLMELNCVLIKENHTIVGDNLSGEWVGMIRQIMDGEYETTIHPLNPTVDRVQYMDFARFIVGGYTYMITRFPRKTGLRPEEMFAFDWGTWILLVLAIGVLGLLWALFEVLTNNRVRLKKFGQLTVEGGYKAVALIFQQGQYEQAFQWTASYIVFGLWGLCCVVLAGLYSSHVLNSALKAEYKVPFSDLSSLANCISIGRCRIVAQTLSVSYFERIYRATSGAYYELQRALQHYPPVIVNTSIVDALLDVGGGFDYPVYISSAAQYSSLIRGSPSCSIEGVVAPGFDLESFIFSKNNRELRDLFSEGIKVLVESGKIAKLQALYVGGFIDNQEWCKKETVESDPMTLDTFLGAFLALTIGAGLSALLLVAEKTIAAFKKKLK